MSLTAADLFTDRRLLRRLATALLIVGPYLTTYAPTPSGAQPVPRAPSVDREHFLHHGELMFISEGALWDLDGATGKLTPLAPAGEQPRDGQFSPNGRWLSYSLGSGQVWLARSDGYGPRLVAEGGWDAWLPDGRLLAGEGVWAVSASGALRRAGAVPSDLAGWSPDGKRYAFIDDSLVVSFSKPTTGTDRLQVSSSLYGKRVTWYESRVSFSAAGGSVGNFLDAVYVLPGTGPVLFTLGPFHSASLAADGLGLYEVRSPGAPLVKLGVTVGDTLAVGPHGTFAFTNGPNRYAWLTKSAVTCSAATATCSPVPAPSGELTMYPTWAPQGIELAFVEAPASSAGDFWQATVQRWYGAHTLWVLPIGRPPFEVKGAAGASAPVWSADAKSLMYVADDSLWLLPVLSKKAVRIESPLFQPGAWPSYYGQVNWSGQFAWSSRDDGPLVPPVTSGVGARSSRSVKYGK